MVKFILVVKGANLFITNRYVKRYLISLIILLNCLPGYTQNNKQNNIITASYTEVPLKDILKDLSEKTGVTFSYSTRKIPDNTKITISLNEVTFYDALKQIFSSLPISFEVVDDYIVLKKISGNIDQPKEEVQKKFTLSGYIKDKVTSEFLIGATVFIRDLNIGCITNNYGFFSVTVPTGSYSLEISYVGYERIVKTFELKSNLKFDYKMEYLPVKLGETIIPAFQREEQTFKLHAAQIKVSPAYVEQQPSLMGEPDVIKSLGHLSGIVLNGEGSSYFHVRGGNYDQNLIILDEATIFNPSHLLGIFSPIIPDAVKTIDVYKADIPVNFGGRLSSVIDIHTKDGNKNNIITTGNIGLISARGTVEGPIKKDASSFFISFRRSYFDAYLKPSLPTLKDLYFSDFTSKFNIKLGSKDRLFITLYTGKDVLLNKTDDNDNNGINWTNQSFTLRWNHIFGSRTFLNSSFYTSKYDYYLNTSTLNNEYWNSRITNASLKEELSFFATPNIVWRFGLKISFYGFNPGNYFSPKINGNVQVSPVNSSEAVIYGGAEHEITPWFKLNYGLQLISWSDFGDAFIIRFDSLYNQIKTDLYGKDQNYYSHSSLAPRISASVKTGNNSSIKASYNRTNQNINLITNSLSPFNSLEVWLPSGPNIKPQYADIADLGYVFSMGAFDVQTDLYYKWMYNQIGYKYHANMLVNPAIEGELRQGKGWSYGWEIAVKKETGKFRGQVNYTYSRAFLHIKDLNAGRNYPASWDRPHCFNVSLVYQPRQRWLFSAEYNISSGSRITTPTSFYYYRGYQVPVYTSQNNDRLPVYKRLDLTTTFQLNKIERKFNHSITFSILNFGGRQNPIFLYFNKYINSNGNLTIPMDRLKYNELTPSMRYTYGLIPSFTYQFKF